MKCAHCRITLVFFVIMIVLMGRSNAQLDSLLLVNSKEIDDKRYKDIKGSPFLFDDFVVARVIRNDANIIEDALLNYNGYTQTFEVKSGNSMIELDRSWYLRVEIDAAKNPEIRDQILGDRIVFQRGIHQKFQDYFTILLFVGKDLFLIKDVSVRLSEHTIQDVGKSVTFQKFSPRSLYYIKRRGKLTHIKLKKKSLIDALASPEVETYIKREKLRCTTEEDIVRVLEYFNGLSG